MKFKEGNSPYMYDALIFMDESKRKKWEDQSPNVKEFIADHLTDYIKNTETSITLDILANVINDLNVRIKKLENEKNHPIDKK